MLMLVPMPAMEASLQRLKSASRSSGTFSAFAITVTGSGTANASTKSSDEPSAVAASIASISPVVMSRIVGSRSEMTLGVNALLIRRRKRVCAGGSAVSMVRTGG